uniref:Uncharacterized protein n=1 Tax=Aegilops tauschii subsp. strangulata TaxID=200361 RepID=A0A453FBS8_AEGTS
MPWHGGVRRTGKGFGFGRDTEGAAWDRDGPRLHAAVHGRQGLSGHKDDADDEDGSVARRQCRGMVG